MMWKHEDKAPLGLYVHIPFCVRKCLYCDFLSAPASGEERDIYCHMLRKELALWAEDERIRDRDVDTVFFGGGTPSLLELEEISAVMETIRRNFSLTSDVEISLECNPGTVSREKFTAYRRLGINRLSIGMQSMVDEELEVLGRIHRAEDFTNAFQMAREAGFDNINVDIMSAIPGQTIESYRYTLSEILTLNPEHISSYSLVLEEGTPFYEKYQDEPPVDEKTDRMMYELTEQMLSAGGYKRYEISNYARPGRECRHNLKYWHRDEYVGVGLGAASFLSEQRLSNYREMAAYGTCIAEKQLPVEETEKLTKQDAMAEFMYLGLRCMEGVSERAFAAEFDLTLSEVYGDVIARYMELGLLDKKGNRLSLTKRGIDVSNIVFADFI